MGSGPSLNIVLLGNSGVGKSASGNTILGRKAFVSKRSFSSVTKEVSKQTDRVFGKQITVVDTPGILGSEKEVTTLCQDLLKSKEPCLFLIVVKIDRFTDEQNNAVEAAIRAIGDEGFENCHLLFTSGDALNYMELDDFIKDDPESPLPTLVGRFKGRYHVFNNENGGLEQVQHLLEESGHLSDVVSRGDPRRMVLLGLPGEGKSASGKMIKANNGEHFISEMSTWVQMPSEGGSKTVSKTTTSNSWVELGKGVVEWVAYLAGLYRGGLMLWDWSSQLWMVVMERLQAQ